MLTARAFCITRRRWEFEVGSGPADLTAIVMSLPIRANCFAMRFQRANIACFLTSKMRPMKRPEGGGGRHCSAPHHGLVLDLYVSSAPWPSDYFPPSQVTVAFAAAARFSRLNKGTARVS